MSATLVTWVKSEANTWLPLKFNIASVGIAAGCYVIWHGGQTPRVVRVGQGNIADRLTAHGNDPAILKYGQFGPLLVTWAELQASYLNGVERYLADALNPLVGDRHPTALPIRVNLPWAA